jgi:hypothetical protein
MPGLARKKPSKQADPAAGLGLDRGAISARGNAFGGHTDHVEGYVERRFVSCELAGLCVHRRDYATPG